MKGSAGACKRKPAAALGLWPQKASRCQCDVTAYSDRLDYTPEEGWRLASLADGEGHFSIRPSNPQKPSGGTYQCEFIVAMRADDAPFLERFASVFGGRMYCRQDGDCNPIARWVVATKVGCLRLVEVFDAHPLWSKKQRDYLIWREAVLYWASVSGRDNDWGPMVRLRDELRAIRRYQDAGVQLGESRPPHGLSQLSLLAEVPDA